MSSRVYCNIHVVLLLQLCFQGGYVRNASDFFCTAFTHSGSNTEFDKPGSSKFKSSDVSKAQQRRYLLYVIFLLEAGPEGKDNVSSSGQHRFFRRHECIIRALWRIYPALISRQSRQWSPAKYSRRYGARRRARFLPVLAGASADPQGWGIATF